ncbi:MAG: hypothetical protein QXY55_05925 [Candidatus Korarchaeota archaeon]
MKLSDLEVRIHQFFTSFYNLYKNNYRLFVEIFLRGIDEDVRNLPEQNRLLANLVAEIIRILRTINYDTLSEMREFVEKHRSSYRYVIVVDCLGIPDMYALWSSANRKGLMPLVKTFINIKAITQSFKEKFGADTMADVASSLRGLVIKRLDTFLHTEMPPGGLTRDNLIFMLVKRMAYVSTILLEKDTMVLSDHGYDIKRSNSLYVISHGYVKESVLAKLAPVILIK